VAGLTDDTLLGFHNYGNTPAAVVASVQHRLRRGWIDDVASQSSPSPFAADPGAALAFKLHSRQGAKRVIFLEFQGCRTEVQSCADSIAAPQAPRGRARIMHADLHRPSALWETVQVPPLPG
jgi:hypothetical protein